MAFNGNSSLRNYWWHFVGALFVILVGAVLLYGLVPLSKSLHEQTVKQIKTHATLQDDNTLPEKVEASKKENRKLSAILTKLKSKESFDETAVLAEMYQVVDSLKFNLTKLQVGEPIKGSAGNEIPLEVEGTGSYNAIGQLVAHVEQMDRFSRIIVCSIKKKDEHTLRLSLSVRILEVK